MKISYTYWKESDRMFLGYLNEFPDHWTQGIDLEDLVENLADLYRIFTQNEMPGIKRVAKFELA
jgi:predicted RNase H-like HicB family nuclease